MNTTATDFTGPLEILVIKLHGQEFCVRTTSIREIRGWTPVTPLPHAPYDVLGITNLRGSVIPIIDLSVKLGMAQTEATERSAIVVAEVNDLIIGLLVDGVSDIVTVPANILQPMPNATGVSADYSDGIIAQGASMICFLNLDRMFGDQAGSDWTLAA